MEVVLSAGMQLVEFDSTCAPCSLAAGQSSKIAVCRC